MKSTSITALVCGTLLILAPILDNVISMSMVTLLMSETKQHVDLHGSLPDGYSNWCMFIGACLLICGLWIASRGSAAVPAAEQNTLKTPREAHD